MNRFYRCFAALLAAALVLGAGTADLDDLRGVSLKNAKVPVYRSRADGKDAAKQLQMMIFLRTAGRESQLIRGSNVVLELIRRDADPDEIRDNWRNSPPYPLDAGLRAIAGFWNLGHLAYSEGMLFSPDCAVEPLKRKAAGDDNVYFRSPQLDIDGVGFRADFDSRKIQVLNDVRIVVRPEECDPRIFLAQGKLPERYAPVRATADSLLIDMASNQVMLIGSVRITEARGVLECDRFSIFLGSSRKETAATAADKDVLVASGVSSVLADGSVRITRSGEGEAAGDMLTSEHMEYNLSEGVLVFSGDEKHPEIVRSNGDKLSGERILLIRPEQRMVVPEKCRIESAGENGGRRTVTADRGEFSLAGGSGELRGNVRIEDETMVLECPRISAELAREALPDEAKKEDDDPFSLIGTDSSEISVGARELERARCFDGVRVTGKKDGEKLYADFAELRNLQKELDLVGHVKAEDRAMSLECDKLRIHFTGDSAAGSEFKRAVALGNLKIVGKEQPGGEELGPRGVSTLTADRGEFDMPSDLVTFSDNVRVFDKQSSLTCDKLEIFLADRTDGGEFGGVSFAGAAARRKLPKQAVASGKVVMTDPGAKLDTERLTTTFVPLPAGAKPEPGILQSGGVRLTAIECDGGVHAERAADAGKTDVAAAEKVNDVSGGIFSSSAGKRTLAADRARVDLVKNVTDFYDHVKLTDEQGTLECGVLTIHAVPDNGEASDAGAADDPDADPYELASFTESQVPSRITLGNGLKLDRIICRDQVVITRTDSDGRKQQAGGEYGEYIVSDRFMSIVGNDTTSAWLRDGKFRRNCKKLLYRFDSERFEVADLPLKPTVTAE